ncbi:MAG TPA: threonine/serine exporter family protein, partial [Gemmatimonadaceae bacterium]
MSSSFAQRARFLTDFARRLHLAGVSAARLEGAVKTTAAKMGVDCAIWSSPTGILLSLGDPGDPNAGQHTRVLRLDPAQPNLSDLSTLDDVAVQVLDGRLDVVEASRLLEAMDRPADRRDQWWTVFAVGLA